MGICMGICGRLVRGWQCRYMLGGLRCRVCRYMWGLHEKWDV